MSFVDPLALWHMWCNARHDQQAGIHQLCPGGWCDKQSIHWVNNDGHGQSWIDWLERAFHPLTQWTVHQSNVITIICVVVIAGCTWPKARPASALFGVKNENGVLANQCDYKLMLDKRLRHNYHSGLRYRRPMAIGH